MLQFASSGSVPQSAMMDSTVDYYPPSLLRMYGLSSIPKARDSTPGLAATDIGWVPDLQQYEERAARAFTGIAESKTLPSGWPNQLSGPLVWSGSDPDGVEENRYDLSNAQIHEIKEALVHVKCRSLQPLQ